MLSTIESQIDAFLQQTMEFEQLSALRACYEHKLSFDDQEKQQLLAITGEHGTNCYARLQAEETTSVDELARRADERMRYWQARAHNSMAANRDTRRAAMVMFNSCQDIRQRVRQARDLLYG